MRALLLAAAFGVLALLIAPPPASAEHFCADLAVSNRPSRSAASRTSSSSAWRTRGRTTRSSPPWRSASRGRAAGGGSAVGRCPRETKTFPVSATPPSQGTASVSMRVTGFQGSPADAATCPEQTESLQIVSAPNVGGIGIAFLLLGVVIVVVLVVVVVVLALRERPPQMVPPPMSPPPPPPQAPPPPAP